MREIMLRGEKVQLDDEAVDEAAGVLRANGYADDNMDDLAAFLAGLGDPDYAERELPALEQAGKVSPGLAAMTMLANQGQGGASGVGAGMLPGGGPSGVPRPGGLPPNPMMAMMAMGR